MAANDFGVDLESLDRTVYVTNVAPAASIEKLSEFFGFCGKIRSLRLRKAPDGTQEALIEFDAPSASKTALMLKDALIEGVPICVAPLSQESLPSGLQSNASSESVEQANLEGQRYAEETGEQERTSTSVVASLLGAGYTLGNNAFQGAVQYDQQNQISQKAQEVMQTVQATASHYDERYGVSTSVTNLWEQSKAMAMPYVEKTSEAAAPYIQTAKVTANNAATSAMENPSVRSAVDTVNTSVVNLQDETKRDIERRQQEQQGGVERVAEEEEEGEAKVGGGGGGEQPAGWEGDRVVIREDNESEVL